MRITLCFLLGLVTINAVFVKKPSDPNAAVFAELEEVISFIYKRLKNTLWEESCLTQLPSK
jgi:hypothetical protein